jgi:bacterioferritin-associated ferredoxin
VYACICAAVTTTKVRECVRNGALTVDDIGDHCGAGTGCGTCVERLAGLLEGAAPAALSGSLD